MKIISRCAYSLSMIFVRSVLAVISLLISVMSLAQAIEAPPSNSSPQSSLLSEHPEWFKCQSDNDCIVTTGGGWCTAVNKIYVKKLDKFLLEKHNLLPNKFICDTKDVNLIHCEKNRCEEYSRIPLAWTLHVEKQPTNYKMRLDKQ